MQKLADNRDLERRLELVEAQLQQNIDGDATSISSSHSAKSDSTVRPVKSLLGAYPIHHEFEETLYASWVYRRNRTVRESMSFHSSVIRQSTWSMLSELSLGQISVISVIALPVQRSELSNAQWYGPNINKEEGYRENVSGGDTAQVSEIQLPEASTNQRVIPYFPPGYNGLGGPTDSHSLDTSELTGVNQEMQNDEFSDSDIIDMEMLLHNPWRDGHQGFSGGKHLGATNSSSGNRKTLNDYLSKSLKKSNIAVLRDNNGDWEGSIVSYTKACKLLKSAALIVPDSEDRAKLGSLHATYSLRISELETMCGHRPYRGGHNTEEREVNTLELIDLLVDADVMYP